MNTIQLTVVDYVLLAALLTVPLGLIFWLRLPVLKTAVIGVLRMVAQLALVGLYLKVIFELNSWLLNSVWILAMLLVATNALLGRSGLRKGRFFMLAFVGTAVGSVAVSAFFVFAVIQPAPLYDARYLIPVFGMVLGNCMRGNVLSLERFYAGIREKENEFISWQMMGATVAEASHPFMQRALMTSLGPQLSTIATMGIVSLPGMMTGQILGGSFPTTAIAYQIAIVICILAAQLLSSVLNIFLTRPAAFNEMGMLRPEIFTSA